MSETFDLDSALETSYKEIMSRGDGEGVPSADAPPSVEAPAETPQAPERERQRAPDGKFAKEEAKSVIAEQPVIGEVKEIPDQTVLDGALKAPESWSAAMKQEWAKLPLSIQEEIFKRENDVSKGFKQYGERVKSYEAIDKVLSPKLQAIQAAGMTGADYIGRLVEAENRLNSNPVEAIKWLAQSYGVNLSNLTQEQPQGSPEIEPLRQQLTELSNWKQQQEQATQAQLQQSIQSDIEKFSADPKNEFYGQVKEKMGSLFRAGEAKDLSDAYEKAIWIVPEVRQIMQARQIDALSKKTAETAATKAKDAVKSAGSVVKGSGLVPVGPDQTWQQTLEAKARSMAN